MPAVLVHGLPVTAAVWDRLLDALDRDDVVVLRLPGFGAPLPSGFVPTMDRYAEWLAEVTSDLDEIDFVGQDWGVLDLPQRQLSHRRSEPHVCASRSSSCSFADHSSVAVDHRRRSPNEGRD